jgi:hypothetical protein
MNKFTIVGLCAWLISLVIVGFQAITSLMVEGGGGSFGAPPGGWSELAIVDLVGDDKLYWAVDYDWLVYIFTMPLYILLFIVGLVLIIMGMVFWRK